MSNDVKKELTSIEVLPEDIQQASSEIEERVHQELAGSKEMQNIEDEFDIHNHDSLLSYGKRPAEEIAGFADKILLNVKSSEDKNSFVILKELSKVMKRFDPEDFQKESKGFFSKLFNDGKKAVDKVLSKYQDLGGEIENISTEITAYKEGLSKSNDMLDDLFQQNLMYFEELEKYIFTGNKALEMLKQEELPKLEELAKSREQMDLVNLETFRNGVELLDQRLYDLEMAKMVALQTAPQIRNIQKGNYKLIAKIESAFVVTIPLFKNGLVQAVALKRQKHVADSMQALDDVTNDLLKRNAQMTKEQSMQIARLSGGSVSLETLETTWKTIVEGIDETQAIEEENKVRRQEGLTRIHEMQKEIQEKLGKT